MEGKKEKYDFFISFYRNAFKPEVGTGAEVFVYSLSNPTSKSKLLADKIQLALVNVGFRYRGVKEANFYVLKNTRAPALLLEIGFIDNSADNQLFDAQFETIADGIVNAIFPTAKMIDTCPSCGQNMAG